MIDEKGKLFGKINIVDLVVVVLALLVLLAVGLKFAGKGEPLPGATGSSAKITYTVQVNGVYPEVYEHLRPYVEQPGGDQLMASGNLLPGYVVGVLSTPHESSASIQTSTGALVLPLRDDLLDLTFTIEANVPNRDLNEVGTQEVRIGKAHTVKTTHFEFGNGLITDCQWADQNK